MKSYIKDQVKMLEEYPCKNCDAGYGSFSSGKDEKGEYIEITSCQDDCYKYKRYIDRCK